MFHKTIETTKDAVEYLQGGEKAGDILERLEQLSSILTNSDSPQDEEEDN